MKLILAVGFLLAFATGVNAQKQRTQTYLPKIAIKTNALYWATSTPNLGLEIGLAKKLTLDISGNYNPWKFSDNKQLKHWLVQPVQWQLLRPARTLCRCRHQQPKYVRFGTRPV